MQDTIPTFGDLQKEGDDQQENEVIKLEERAPPIAENGKLEHVSVHMKIGSEGVTVFLEVSLEAGERDGGLEATDSCTPHRDNEEVGEKEIKRKRKKKVKKQEQVDLQNRTPWTLGSSSPAPTVKARAKPKAHKVLESDKKMTYSKKRDLLLQHLRAVNSSHEKNSIKSPERARTPEAPLRKKAQTNTNSIGEADSYLAALDSAQKAKQLNADRLSPTTVKKIPKVMDRSSDYKKRYGRLSPQNAANRWRARASVGQHVGSPATEVVSLKLTELFFETRESRKEKETTNKREKVSKQETSDVSESSTPSTPNPKSPPPVEMSFKLSDLGISVAGTTVQAVRKFKSFKSTKYTAAKDDQDVVAKEESIHEEEESSELVEETSDSTLDPIPADDVDVQKERLSEEEVKRALDEFSQGGSTGEEEEKGEEENEDRLKQVPAGTLSGGEIEEAGDKEQAKGTGLESIDPQIVEYFMEHEEDMDQETDTGKAKKKKKKKKKSKLKKFFGKILCRK